MIRKAVHSVEGDGLGDLSGVVAWKTRSDRMACAPLTSFHVCRSTRIDLRDYHQWQRNIMISRQMAVC